MKSALIALALLASSTSFAAKDLGRCNGDFLVVAQNEIKVPLEQFFMQTQNAGLLTVKPLLAGSASSSYSVKFANPAVEIRALEALKSVQADSRVRIECNSQLSF